MANSILELAQQRTVLLDGAMGTELIKKGLSSGACPEMWNIEKPDLVRGIHQSYYEAGADAVLTNSFGGNPIKLRGCDLEKRHYELNLAAATLANEVKPSGKFVGGSMGPSGRFLKPQGDLENEDLEKAFAAQAGALQAGKVDFLIIETMYDLREALCALRGARSVSSLPVFVTMTFNQTARGFFTLMGDTPAHCLKELEQCGAQAAGTNCTLDSFQVVELVREMRRQTALPLIVQPNAGKPELSPSGQVTYSQSLQSFLQNIPLIMQDGANMIGGCCGTDPEFIRHMAEIIRLLRPTEKSQ
jgi:5-methyltetrahydrofolate--homocysteine methyltransferase